MTRFLVRRAFFALLLVVVVSSASLVLARLAPGDYATDALGVGAHPELVAATRARYGLDRPLAEQYAAWLRGLMRLDFGRSLAYDRPVADLVKERAGRTAVLALTALVLATLAGLPLGVVAGASRRPLVSGSIGAVSLVLASMPPLLTSLVLVFVAARTGWLPVGGMRGIEASGGGLADVLRHMVVPVLALALPVAAMFERLQAQAMREVMAQPFILGAVARGIPWRRIVWRGAFKAALRPVASVYGLVAGSLLGGSFAVEMITAWPGLGPLMLDALRARDVYLVAGCAAAGSVFLAVGAMVSDLLLALVDPRVAAE